MKNAHYLTYLTLLNLHYAIPFLDTFPIPSGNKVIISVHRKPTHIDRLDFNSNHPKSVKHAVVRALPDRPKNVCSSPELLAEGMDHLGKVLKYNNYLKWMIDQHGRNYSQAGRLIDLETGNEVKKSIFISAPYFPGLSESFKQLLKYTHVQVCFKGQNNIKLMLIHSKDKVDPLLKKDVVYQWSCTNPGCKSSYIGKTSWSLCEHVKEHSKEGSNSAIYQRPPTT